MSVQVAHAVRSDGVTSGPERPSDDLLTGFERTGPRRVALRAYLTTGILGSLYVFDTAFRFGAYHTVFYSQEQHIAVVSAVILIGMVILRREARLHLYDAVVFAPPLLLFLFRLATPSKHPSGALHAIDDVLIIVTAVVMPLILWVVVRLLAPEFFDLPTWRLRTAVVATILIIAAVGYVDGRFNYRTLTCQDFIVAGDHPPPNCRHQ